MYYVEIRAIEVGSEIACGLAIDSTPPRLSCPRNLESNQLTGLLPIQWSRLTNLQHLVINNNAVKGELPREWSGLAMLHRLEATNNALTGQVPGEWKGLKYLNYLALEGEPCAADARERDPTLRRNHLIT
mmetsp:Transcript_44746/g.115827  ORF Transcript_44746/g.115827 Transcript_44746/m.115827 type:complete len:130 (+) Transcript_44746:699-1088(+)